MTSVGVHAEPRRGSVASERSMVSLYSNLEAKSMLNVMLVMLPSLTE
jgi:hypothetical protein